MTVNFLTVESLINKMDDNYLSIPEILNVFYKRINEKNNEINAVISKIPYSNLKKRILLSEKRRLENKRYSPIDGFPIAIKDLEETQGILTTSGSKVFQKNIPTLKELFCKEQVVLRKLQKLLVIFFLMTLATLMVKLLM